MGKNKQFKIDIENKFNALWTNTTRVLTCFDSYVCVTNKNDKSHLLWHSAIIVKLCIVELFRQKDMGFILRIFNIFLWLSFSLDMVCKKDRCNIIFDLSHHERRKALMTSQLPRFWCFFSATSWKNHPKRGSCDVIKALLISWRL